VIENNGYGGPSIPLNGIYTRDGDYLRFWSGRVNNTLGYNTIRNNYGYEVVADYGSPRVELGVPTVGGLNAIYDEVVSNPYDAYEVWNRAGNPLLWALDCWWGSNGPQTYGSVSTSSRITSEPDWLGSTGPGGAAKMLASEDKDLKERIEELKKVIVESPDTPEAIEAFSELYGIIRSDLEDELGEKDRFYEYLTELYSKHKSKKLGKFVLRKKVFWKSLEGDVDKVIKLSKKALKEFEKAEAEDKDWLSEARMCVLEDLALTYIHTGDIMNGKSCLDEVMEKYSFDSTMIALIEEEMEDMEDQISEGMMLQKKGVPYWEEEEEDEFIPEEYALAQNYPNPFNPTTTIPFSLPEESHVKIEIYDLSGSCVATLSDKRYQTGNYNVQFNGSGLASGIYFIRTQMVPSEKQGKQHVFTSKMMLLK